MSDFQLLTSQKGKEVLYAYGYTYHLKSHNKGKTLKRWECSSRSHRSLKAGGLKSCGITATTDFAITKFVKEPGTHDHNFVSLAKEKEEYKKFLVQGGTDNRANNSTIINETQSHFDTEQHGYLPSTKASNTIIRNARAKTGHNVKEIRCIDDLKEELRFTIGQGRRKFLQTIIHAGDAHALLFATDESLNSLYKSQIWFADGIYKVTDKPYLQVYVIHGSLVADTMNRVWPLVYCIMSHKRMELYDAIFLYIKQYGIENNLNLDTKFAMIDFEVAVKGAIEAVFEKQIEVFGCTFHLFKNLRERVDGSKNIFSNSENQMDFNKISALSYLPFGRLHILLPILKEFLNNKQSPLSELLIWFENTYIREGSRYEGWWNVNKLIINRLPTTNNSSESFFSRFRKLLDGKRTTLYGVIDLMRKIQHQTDGEMYKLVDQALISRNTFLRRVDQIRFELENYENNDIRLLEKLGAVNGILKNNQIGQKRVRTSPNTDLIPSDLPEPSSQGIDGTLKNNQIGQKSVRTSPNTDLIPSDLPGPSSQGIVLREVNDWDVATDSIDFESLYIDTVPIQIEEPIVGSDHEILPKRIRKRPIVDYESETDEKKKVKPKKKRGKLAKHQNAREGEPKRKRGRPAKQKKSNIIEVK